MQHKEDLHIAFQQDRPLIVNVIGAGRIGMPVIEHILANTHFSLGTVFALQASDLPAGTVTADPDAFFAKVPDIVIDAAGPGALSAYGERALSLSALWSISASAMADREVNHRLRLAAHNSGHPLRFLSGAIVGLDGVAALACDPEATVSVRIERPCITDQYGEIFSGTAREVALFFPHEANVVANVALAGIGMDSTQVTLVSGVPESQHVLQVTAASCFGKMTSSLTIEPLSNERLHPVSASIIAALEQASRAVRVG